MPSADHLELVTLADCCLVDVTGDDQLRSGVDEALQDVRAARDRPLARPPRSTDQLVVEHHDPERAGVAFAKARRDATELGVADAARLVPPRSDRVDPDDVERLRGVDGFGRVPLVLEALPRSREAGREAVRDVVVARHRQHGSVQSTQKRGRPRVLVGPPAMCEIA